MEELVDLCPCNYCPDTKPDEDWVLKSSGTSHLSMEPVITTQLRRLGEEKKMARTRFWISISRTAHAEDTTQDKQNIVYVVI